MDRLVRVVTNHHYSDGTSGPCGPCGPSGSGESGCQGGQGHVLSHFHFFQKVMKYIISHRIHLIESGWVSLSSIANEKQRWWCFVKLRLDLTLFNVKSLSEDHHNTRDISD